MKRGLSFFVLGILVATVVVTSATVVYFYGIYGKGGKIFSKIGGIAENISNETFNKTEYSYLNYMKSCTIGEDGNIVCTNISEFNPLRKGYWKGCFIVFENGTEEIVNEEEEVIFSGTPHTVIVKCIFENNTYYWKTLNETEYFYANYIKNCIINKKGNIVCEDCGKRIMLINPPRTIEIITCLKEYNPPRKGDWEGCLIIFENETEGVIDVGKRATLLLQRCHEEVLPIPEGSYISPLEPRNIICTNITYPVIVECSFENNTYYWKKIS